MKRFGAAAVLVLAVSVPSAVADTSPYAGFPVPPRGATVFSRQFGANALALGVVPRARNRVRRLRRRSPRSSPIPRRAA